MPRAAALLVLLSIPLPALPVLADSAPPAAAYGETITVVADAPFLFPVDTGEPVTIRFGIGELEIEAADIAEVRTELEVGCKETLSETLCEKYRDRLRLAARRSDDGVEVRLEGLPKWKLRKLRLAGHVRVPRGSPLTARIGIGEVDIYGGGEDLAVHMGIGDLTVRVPESTVASVEIGARIGDASLAGGELIEGRRRALIGARLDWHEGTGTSRVTVGVRIGDAKVVLE